MTVLNLDGLIFLVLFILLAPPLILFVVGYLIRKKYERAFKILYLIAILYLLIGLGVCLGGF